MKHLVSLLVAAAWLLLLPEDAHAWGPGTHIALGEGVLRTLYLLPPATRILLERYPLHFLYGSVAADISFAKKYAPVGRHCHHWHVGEEIYDSADTEPMGAVALGYLAHLAADTIAHNIYVPRRLLLTSTTQTLGHTYWEHRMDVHVGEEYLGKARRLVLEHDHSEADALFDAVLSRTLFSFNTNRRLFRGMMVFQDNERWKQVFDQILQKSRFDIPDPLRDRYLGFGFDYVMDYLINRENSRAAALDPIGEMHLRLAKMVRRRGLASGGLAEPGVLEEMADDFFPMPEGPLLYVPNPRLSGADEESAHMRLVLPDAARPEPIRVARLEPESTARAEPEDAPEAVENSPPKGRRAKRRTKREKGARPPRTDRDGTEN
ncbi:MAG: zinc dependent phospholipase C family protein [Gemmatimonadota bacterium]